MDNINIEQIYKSLLTNDPMEIECQINNKTEKLQLHGADIPTIRSCPSITDNNKWYLGPNGYHKH